jgi:hypothetical protein
MTQSLHRKHILEEPDSKEYKLGCQLKIAPNHYEIRLIRTIGATEMESINKAIKQLGDFGRCCALYELCEKTYLSILSHDAAIKKDFPANRHRRYEYIEEAAQEMNRLLLNYLAGFKTFVDHLSTRYTRLRRKESSFPSSFKKITAACYDRNFSYRFFYKLRNYIQHCEMPFRSMRIIEQPAPDGSEDIDISICFDRDALLSTYKKWGDVKADLERQPEQIELLPHLREFQSQVQLINIVVSNIEIALAVEPWQSINKLVQEVIKKYPSGKPMIGRYIESESGKLKFDYIEFPFHTIRKFREKLKEIRNF